MENCQKIFNSIKGRCRVTPRPLSICTFNLAARVLIWKIELNREVKGIYPESVVNVNKLPLQDNFEFFAHESNNEKSKN